MTPAVFDQTTVDIVAQAKLAYDFRVTGSVLKFDGFLKFEEEDKRARQAAKDEGREGRGCSAKPDDEAKQDAQDGRATRTSGAPAAGAERWPGADAGASWIRSRSLRSRRRATTKRAW